MQTEHIAEKPGSVTSTLLSLWDSSSTQKQLRVEQCVFIGTDLLTGEMDKGGDE